MVDSRPSSGLLSITTFAACARPPSGSVEIPSEGTFLQRARPLARVAVCTLLLAAFAGCTSINQLPDPNPASETLVVAYGDPGLTPDPCDDELPQIDGVATDAEWSSAPPLFVHMTGKDG